MSHMYMGVCMYMGVERQIICEQWWSSTEVSWQYHACCWMLPTLPGHTVDLIQGFIPGPSLLQIFFKPHILNEALGSHLDEISHFKSENEMCCGVNSRSRLSKWSFTFRPGQVYQTFCLKHLAGKMFQCEHREDRKFTNLPETTVQRYGRWVTCLSHPREAPATCFWLVGHSLWFVIIHLPVWFHFPMRPWAQRRRQRICLAQCLAHKRLSIIRRRKMDICSLHIHEFLSTEC